jgi:two-component system chemotaxis response regulator CheY
MASILVIEDVPAVLLSVKVILEGSGHQVTAAANGTRGLDLLKSTTFDLVITDLWMPGLSGVDVIRVGKEHSPKLRFLAITGGDPERPGQLDALGREDFEADFVLLKPFEKAELLSAVSLLLDTPG